MKSSPNLYLLAGGSAGFERVSVSWLRKQRHGKTRVTSLQIGGRKCQVWLVDLPKGRKFTFALGIKTEWHSPNYKGVTVRHVSGLSDNSECASQSMSTPDSSREIGVGRES